LLLKRAENNIRAIKPFQAKKLYLGSTSILLDNSKSEII
jgi:hypothetical protein